MGLEAVPIGMKSPEARGTGFKNTALLKVMPYGTVCLEGGPGLGQNGPSQMA